MNSWKKVEEMGDFNNMKKGTPLIKYLGAGNPIDNIPPNDKNYSTFTVDAILSDELNIQVSPTQSMMGTSIVTRGLSHRKFENMIQEGYWWYKPF